MPRGCGAGNERSETLAAARAPGHPCWPSPLPLVLAEAWDRSRLCCTVSTSCKAGRNARQIAGAARLASMLPAGFQKALLRLRNPLRDPPLRASLPPLVRGGERNPSTPLTREEEVCDEIRIQMSQRSAKYQGGPCVTYWPRCGAGAPSRTGMRPADLCGAVCPPPLQDAPQGALPLAVN
jgi:hypothetical protein